jgi:hypothetical protein
MMHAVPGTHPSGKVATRHLPKSLPVIFSNLPRILRRKSNDTARHPARFSSIVPDIRKTGLMRAFLNMAGGPGFEPGLAESESAVLPLDDPPIDWQIIAVNRCHAATCRELRGADYASAYCIALRAWLFASQPSCARLRGHPA